jgi:hypothetical protein
MKVKDFIQALKNYDENLEVNLLKGSNYDPVAFWDSHEWFLCEKKYTESRRDESFLAILIDE